MKNYILRKIAKAVRQIELMEKVERNIKEEENATLRMLAEQLDVLKEHLKIRIEPIWSPKKWVVRDNISSCSVGASVSGCISPKPNCESLK